MSVRHKAQFPTPGCIVEFLQGNSPVMGYVLDTQNDRIRLYTQTKKEMKLPLSRLLPWFGPSASSTLNRAAMEALLEEHLVKRQTLRTDINVEELWQLAEGEIQRASAGWFASLVFDDPDIDCEAAMGHALLEHKTHFKFNPPEFEIFPLDIVEKRVEEARAAQLRETLALQGNKFFHKLWDVHLGKSVLNDDDLPPADLGVKLDAILHAVMADNDAEDGLWKLLCRGLPNEPHLALYLATAWGIVPRHYNYLLDKAGYDATSRWAAPFTAEAEAMQRAINDALQAYGPAMPDPFITVDPDSTIDRDDAFFVKQHPNGRFTLKVAIACPSLFWPFGSAFDKEVLRRATSLYLPEGNLHMLPPHIGCAFFSLNAGEEKLALVTSLEIDRNGTVLETDIAIRLVNPAANMTLCQAENLILSETGCSAAPTNESPGEKTASAVTRQDQEFAEESLDFKELMDSGAPLRPIPALNCPEDVPQDFLPYAAMLKDAYALANTLQAKRLQCGAVILERPDCDITLFPLEPAGCGVGERLNQQSVPSTCTQIHGPATRPPEKALSEDSPFDKTSAVETFPEPPLPVPSPESGFLANTPYGDTLPEATTPSGKEDHSGTSTCLLPDGIKTCPGPIPKGLTKQDTCLVHLAQAPSTPRAHRVIGELMIAANAAMGYWGNEHEVPLLYRNQDIALPPEYSRVWDQPHDIVRIARSLPAATLEPQPRKHTGLGITAYATCTSPMRRYVDLLNQGQIIASLSEKPLPHSLASLKNLLPLLQARLDSVGQVQRTRPRYWKLLFFRQQGDKAWWPGVVTDENNAFVTVALPWAQMMVRGRRKLFQEKIVPGTHVIIRVGKIHPLQNEITLLEALEQ